MGGIMNLKKIWHSEPCKWIKWLLIIICVAAFGSWFINSAAVSWMPKWLPLKQTATYAATAVLKIEAERLLLDDSIDAAARMSRKDEYTREAIFTAGHGAGEIFMGGLNAGARWTGVRSLTWAVRQVPGFLVRVFTGEYFVQWFWRPSSDSDEEAMQHKTLGMTCADVGSSRIFGNSMWGAFHPATFGSLLAGPIISRFYNRMYREKRRPQISRNSTSPTNKRYRDPKKNSKEGDSEGIHWGWYVGIGGAVILILVAATLFMQWSAKDDDEVIPMYVEDAKPEC